jgi:hypothetical protein
MSTDNRHRDKNGEIRGKHGNTLVGTLRRIYLLAKLHETSLTQLVQDHAAGHLDEKVRQAALA